MVLLIRIPKWVIHIIFSFCQVLGGQLVISSIPVRISTMRLTKSNEPIIGVVFHLCLIFWLFLRQNTDDSTVVPLLSYFRAPWSGSRGLRLEGEDVRGFLVHNANAHLTPRSTWRASHNSFQHSSCTRSVEPGPFFFFW